MKHLAAGITIGILLVPAFGGGMIQSKTAVGSSESPGVTDTNTSFFFRSLVTDSGSLSCRLEVEVQAIGTPFTNSPNVIGNLVASGGTSEAAFTAGTSLAVAGYHWQARVANSLAVVTAFQSFGANPEADADFTIDLRPPLPTALAQQMVPGGGNSPPGSFDTNAQIQFVGLVTDPDAENYFLDIEIALIGSPFTGTTSFTTLSIVSGSPGSVTANLSPTFLPNPYRWRMRARNALTYASDWVSFGANPETDADFVEGVPDPFNLKQAMKEFDFPMPSNPVGAMDTNAFVQFAGTWTDPENTNNYELQVEVQPLSAAFTGTPTATGGFTGSGTQAQLTINGSLLSTQTGYHWRARIRTAGLNYVSNWVLFGANPETDADFIEGVPDPFNLKQAMKEFDFPMPSDPVGAMDTNAFVQFAGTWTDPENSNNYELQVEVQPLSAAFTGTPTATGGFTGSGTQAQLTINGSLLSTQTGYHWRGRIRTASLNYISNWVSFGANPETDADFVEGVPDPFNLKQAMKEFDFPMPSDPVGAMDTNAFVQFAGTWTDPENSNNYELQVEVQPLSAAFTGTPTATGGFTGSGTQAQLTINGSLLSTQTGYHWRGRIRTASLNYVSNWVSFGANPETDADFVEGVPDPFNLKQAMNSSTFPMPSDPVGSIDPDMDVRFAGTWTDPENANNYELQVEVQPLSSAFTGTPTMTGGFTGSGTQAEITISGAPIAAEGGYHWRARIRTASLNYLSSWVSFGGNPEGGADFIVGGTPLDPTPVQAGTGGGASQPVGFVDTDGTLFLRSAVATVSGLGTVVLEVEVQPVGAPFGGTANGSSGATPSGGTAEVQFTPITDGAYRWRARGVAAGGASSWIEFGGNPAPDADFFRDGAEPNSIVTTTGNRNAATYGGMILGTAADVTSGVVLVEISIQRGSDGQFWNGAAFQAAPVFVNAAGTTTWSFAFGATDGESYTIQSRATDAGGVVETTPGTGAFTFDTTLPVSIPTTSGTISSSVYPGAVQGTATDAIGILSVSVSIRDTGSGLYWNGAAFVAGPVFILASGTSAWSAPFATIAGVIYEVQSRAIDLAGNVQVALGQSTFTVDSTGPDSVVTTSGAFTTATFPGAISGTASTAAGATVTLVEITIQRASDGFFFDGAAFVAGPTFLGAAGTTSWTFVFAPGIDTFTVNSRATDSTATVETSLGIATFTVATSLPVSTITTTGIFVLATWPGSVQGTATGGSGGILSVEVALQRDSDGFFWNGTGWQAAQVFLPATGTATWMLPFTPGTGESYTVFARATDAAAVVESPPAIGFFAFAGDIATGGGGAGSSRSRARCQISASGAAGFWLLALALLPLVLRRRR